MISRQRVGLVHELRELRRAEELAHRGRRRLGVDQVVRHHRVDLDRAHALADRALHAQQADAVLVLHQLADRAHAAIAEMVDVVDLAAAVLQFDQHLEDREDVLLAQHAHACPSVWRLEARVHLHAADGREVVALGIEEQAVEQRLGRLQRRRLARAHDAVDVDQRFLARRRSCRSPACCGYRGRPSTWSMRQHRQLGDVRLLDRVEQLRGELRRRPRHRSRRSPR